MTSTTFRLPTKSFRSIPSPHGTSKFGFFFAGADKLPKGLWDWRRVNPREVNTKTAVFKAITATLSQNPERFHERNRGITIVAKTLSFDDKKQEVVMELSDNELMAEGDQEIEAWRRCRRRSTHAACCSRCPRER